MLSPRVHTDFYHWVALIYVRESSYEKAFALLNDHYGREEIIFDKTEKFFLVCQLAREYNRNYPASVEQLSHDADFDDVDALRRRYCLVLAINGLRDTKLRMELMAKHGLDWEELKRHLNVRSVAMRTVDVVVGNLYAETSIKREVGVEYNNTKSSTHKACDHYETFHGYNVGSHSNSYLGESDRSSCSNIIMMVMICLVAANHPVIVVDSLHQGEVMAIVGSGNALIYVEACRYR